MEINLKLREAGLAENEIKVYIALLKLGSVTAGDIAKISGVNRTNVYDSLERLIDKGLISFVVKSNKKHFEAKAPEFLINYFEMKEKEIKDKKEIIKSILPEINNIRKLNEENQEAVIYKGMKGLKSISEDVIKTKKEIFVFGAEGNFGKLFGDYFEQWHLKRKINKIPLKIIFNEKVRKKKEDWKFSLSEIRFNNSLEDTPATTWIYGNKVVIIVWSEQPIATLIESSNVSKSYRQFFNVLWENSKK